MGRMPRGGGLDEAVRGSIAEEEEEKDEEEEEEKAENKIKEEKGGTEAE